MLPFIDTFLLLAIVGAFIGGMTNHLAIKMLFRPYRAFYIGKLRVPFTPGVIPKRHEEIAYQLGNLVMEHLITAEALEKRFLDERFKTVILTNLKAQIERYLMEKRPTKEDLLTYVDVEGISGHFQKELVQRVQTWIRETVEAHKEKKLGDLMPEDLKAKIVTSLPEVSRHIADSICEMLHQDATKEVMKQQLDQFFEGRGMLGSMLNMFLGNQSLMDLLYPDLIKFMECPTTQTAIYSFLEKEWSKLEGLTLDELNTKFQFTNQASELAQTLIDHSPLRDWVENPGSTLVDWQRPITECLLPSLVSLLLTKASSEAAHLLKSLEIDQLVSDQVRAFSMQKLESVILMISKREFKMITYLGALLGGIIGVVQAVIMHILS
ncbi:DUF445 family protein [Pullulanibacillus sp. KACC 23026]|uniref:DUF445 domain-containing protein n=1 Tax=Pullulanibacillus sp. KACC 23026 TaxID=3028315 RepID=UPI0023AF5D8E|nr:DUF445 family protein [Pullulanibacillus sp. KACC 23026]WEG12054.1 DUF445 family protein [Pullulanibacillus sp. KACC 23026]